MDILCKDIKVNLIVSGGDRVQSADGVVGWINAGPKCQQYHGMHALCNCYMTSYPYAKAKIKALSILFTEDFP